MSASYTRVNWADYPATTTPVNAENLNKMDAGIAGLTSEINSVESDVSALNSSLDDIDIRYNSTSGKPEWRERGAGSFVPFESGISFDNILYLHGEISNTSVNYYNYYNTVDQSYIGKKCAFFFIRNTGAVTGIRGQSGVSLDNDTFIAQNTIGCIYGEITGTSLHVTGDFDTNQFISVMLVIFE